MCVVRLRAPTIGHLHSCWDFGFYYITNLDFPGDQKPVLKANIASHPAPPAPPPHPPAAKAQQSENFMWL